MLSRLKRYCFLSKSFGKLISDSVNVLRVFIVWCKLRVNPNGCLVRCSLNCNPFSGVFEPLTFRNTNGERYVLSLSIISFRASEYDRDVLLCLKIGPIFVTADSTVDPVAN